MKQHRGASQKFTPRAALQMRRVLWLLALCPLLFFSISALSLHDHHLADLQALAESHNVHPAEIHREEATLLNGEIHSSHDECLLCEWASVATATLGLCVAALQFIALSAQDVFYKSQVQFFHWLCCSGRAPPFV